MEQQYYIFSLTCPAHKDSVALLYYDIVNRRLKRLEFNAEVGEHFQRTLGKELPRNMSELERFRKAKCTVKDITNFDLSFTKFWDTYAYKIGKKARVQKKWNELSREDKIMALGSIRRLRNFYDAKRYDMPYPESYINGRLWENELPQI